MKAFAGKTVLLLVTKLSSHREQERGFVMFLKEMEKIRLPRVKKTFDLDMQFLVIYFKVDTPFKNGIPGKYFKYNNCINVN